MLCFGNISTNSTSNSDSSFSSEKDSSSTAGFSSIENGGSSEMMGVAVFDNDVLVGELTARETLCHLLLRNKVDRCNITIPDPYDSNFNIDLYVYNRTSPKKKVSIVNGSPFIKVNLKLEARILSIDSDSKYDNEKKLQQISSAANHYIHKMITDYLYKTSSELKCDIDGFGRDVLALFLTEPEFEEYHWLKKYKDATFDVTIDTDVKSAFLLGGDQ